MKRLLPFIFLIASCGFNGTQKIETNDSEQTFKIDGEAYNYVIVRLEFLEQVRQLCEDSLLPEDFATERLYKKAVADCTFEHLATLNMGTINDFNNQYCKPDADLSQLTPEQLANVRTACAALGQPIP